MNTAYIIDSILPINNINNCFQYRSSAARILTRKSGSIKAHLVYYVGICFKNPNVLYSIILLLFCFESLIRNTSFQCIRRLGSYRMLYLPFMCVYRVRCDANTDNEVLSDFLISQFS